MRMREIPQLRCKSGTALVLSGGATKAFYFHLGVLKVLGIEGVSSIVGTSAGAVMGSFIASGIDLDTLENAIHQKQVYLPRFDTWMRTMTSNMLFRPQYSDVLRQTLATGWSGFRFVLSLPTLFNRDMLAELIDSLLHSQSHVAAFFDEGALEKLVEAALPSSNFADTEIDLYVTATALDRSQRAVFNAYYDFEDDHNLFMTGIPIHTAVRASSAIPGMFEPVRIAGRYFIDGEFKQTLSADVGIQVADRIIISHTYQPLQLKTGTVRDLGWVNILKQSTFMMLRERIATWHEIYEREHPEKEIFWIEPDADDLEFFLAPEFSFRPEIQKMLIQTGERAALRALETTRVKK